MPNRHRWISTALLLAILTLVLIDESAPASRDAEGLDRVAASAQSSPVGTPTIAGTPEVAVPLLVEIVDFEYLPYRAEIPVGATVRWRNLDFSPHTVTLNGLFDSGHLGRGAAFRYTFTEAGAYFYTCSYHQNMSGFVIVE
ncbi:hypothetical protein BH23CHL5_BH23CHL5_13300 [soil metagenome]